MSIRIILLLVSSLLQEAQVAQAFYCHPSIPIISTPAKKRCNNYNRVNQKFITHEHCKHEYQLQSRKFAYLELHSIKSHHDDNEEDEDNVVINDGTLYSSNIPYETLPLDQILNHLVPSTTTSNKTTSLQQHHVQTGLSSSQALQLLSQIGYNTLTKRKQLEVCAWSATHKHMY